MPERKRYEARYHPKALMGGIRVGLLRRQQELIQLPEPGYCVISECKMEF